MDPQRQKRLNAVAAIAVRLEKETGVPPQAIIAQWALESRWGAEPAGHANYFGVKKAARHALCCEVVTHEVVNGKLEERTLEFADYASLEDSCRDYAWLISHGAPYAAAWAKFLATRDAMGLIFGIASTYATDPNYAALAMEIAGQANVTQSIQEARA